MFKRIAKKVSARKEAAKPFGPWTEDETLAFVTEVVGQGDSVNDRFDLPTVAFELAHKSFDSAELWTELESARLAKWDKEAYSASVVE